MALIQVNYQSKALFRTVPMNVILPADRFDADTDSYLNKPDRKYKTMLRLFGKRSFFPSLFFIAPNLA